VRDHKSNALCIFFFKQKTAYEIFTSLEFRRVLFRSVVGAVDLARTGFGLLAQLGGGACHTVRVVLADQPAVGAVDLLVGRVGSRSEERRVGKEGGSGWSADRKQQHEGQHASAGATEE